MAERKNDLLRQVRRLLDSAEPSVREAVVGELAVAPVVILEAVVEFSPDDIEWVHRGGEEETETVEEMAAIFDCYWVEAEVVIRLPGGGQGTCLLQRHEQFMKMRQQDPDPGVSFHWSLPADDYRLHPEYDEDWLSESQQRLIEAEVRPRLEVLLDKIVADRKLKTPLDVVRYFETFQVGSRVVVEVPAEQLAYR